MNPNFPLTPSILNVQPPPPPNNTVQTDLRQERDPLGGYRKSGRPGPGLQDQTKSLSARSGNQLNRKLRIKANTAKVPAGVNSPVHRETRFTTTTVATDATIRRPPMPSSSTLYNATSLPLPPLHPSHLSMYFDAPLPEHSAAHCRVATMRRVAVCLRVIGKLGPDHAHAFHDNNENPSSPKPSATDDRVTSIVLGGGCCRRRYVGLSFLGFWL